MERSQTVLIAGRPSWSWAMACIAKEPSRDIVCVLIDARDWPRSWYAWGWRRRWRAAAPDTAAPVDRPRAVRR